MAHLAIIGQCHNRVGNLARLAQPAERVRAMVVNHVLPTVIRNNSTFASVNTGEGVSQ